MESILFLLFKSTVLNEFEDLKDIFATGLSMFAILFEISPKKVKDIKLKKKRVPELAPSFTGLERYLFIFGSMFSNSLFRIAQNTFL